MSDSPRVRVLHVIDHLGLGGAQTALLDLLRNRDAAAYDVEVAVMHGRGLFAEEIARLGLKIHSLSAAKWPPAYVPNFLRLLREESFDVLHFHLPAANWLAKPLAALAGHPLRIAHDHSSGDLRFRGLRSLGPDALTHRFSTRVIAVAPEVKAFLVRWEAVEADRVTVIPNGVDTVFFHPAGDTEKRAARQALGLPENAFIIGAMGRLAAEKNFALLVELANLHSDIVVVLGGTGPEEMALRQAVAAANLENRFHLLGQVSDRLRFYRALDVSLLPSLFEGLPMAVLEAMAAGVPLLASRLPGIAAVVREDQDGLLAAPGVLADFDRQLNRLKADPAWRAQLAHSARLRVEEGFSAGRTARAVESVYADVLAGYSVRRR